MRIGAVENDADIVYMLEQACSLQGWQFSACLPEEGVFEWLNRTRPDVVIFEPWLGSLERGWELLEAMKAERATSAIPIILWTSWMHRLEDKETQLAAWGITVLPKPCDLDVLHETIDTVIRTADLDEIRPAETS